jgi:hypothetical protein
MEGARGATPEQACALVLNALAADGALPRRTLRFVLHSSEEPRHLCGASALSSDQGAELTPK